MYQAALMSSSICSIVHFPSDDHMILFYHPAVFRIQRAEFTDNLLYQSLICRRLFNRWLENVSLFLVPFMCPRYALTCFRIFLKILKNNTPHSDAVWLSSLFSVLFPSWYEWWLWHVWKLSVGIWVVFMSGRFLCGNCGKYRNNRLLSRSLSRQQKSIEIIHTTKAVIRIGFLGLIWS